MSDDFAPRWRKSSFSAGDSDCVELAWPGPEAVIRDSKSPAAGTLAMSSAAFTSLVAAIR